MDVNNDGSISREEFLAQAELRYGTLDKNKDGRVGLGEIRKKDIDADKDRSVTKQEFLAHAGKRFRQKDANNDGKLDLNEFKNRKAQ